MSVGPLTVNFNIFEAKLIKCNFLCFNFQSCEVKLGSECRFQVCGLAPRLPLISTLKTYDRPLRPKRHMTVAPQNIIIILCLNNYYKQCIV